ncbi:hypothetical protein AAG906_017353 [Vitis piasezkii]
MAGRQYAHPFDTSIKEFVRHLSNLSFHHNINYISIILCIRKCVQDMGETNVSVIFVHHPHLDSKSFEISVDVFGEKLKGIIVERSRGFTSWIRFGSLSLCCLLEGVEACCRGILGGWVLLAEKLRSLGVSTRDEPRGVFVFSRTESRVGASEGKGRKTPMGEGCEDGELGGLFILFEFENEAEADKVLLRGLRCFKESFLHLKMWDPKVGCSQNVDEDTVAFKELQWARLLVKSEGLEWPSSLQVAIGSSVQTHGQSAKVVVSCEVGEGSCRKNKETALSDFVSTRRAKDESGSFGIQLGSSPPTLNFTEITDEALMEEWDFSSSSTLSGRDGVIIATDGGSERGYGPLKVILAYMRETEVSDLPRRANEDVEEVKEVGSERAFQEVLEKRDKVGELCWHSSRLAKFSRLGMSTEGLKMRFYFS